MADGICTGVVVGDFVKKIPNKDCEIIVRCQERDTMDKESIENVDKFCLVNKSDEFYEKLCSNNAPKHDEELMPCEEDCRRKRCVDRYDSSESSDSGVAVLSCTDCSGSSTSSDITDPGSPYSTTSNHSEDSISQSTKMPPTQNTHHSPWMWNVEDRPLIQQNIEKEKVDIQLEENVKKPSPCPVINRVPLDNTNKVETNKKNYDSKVAKNNNKLFKKQQDVQKMHQGKITEYFKTHVKPINGFKKASMMSSNMMSKNVSSVDQQTQFNSLKILRKNVKPTVPNVKKAATPSPKPKKFTPVTVPRKILPAPAKSETITIQNNLNNILNFPLTLSTVNFTPNLTYLHTKVPKPPDNIFAPQFASITDKINALPSTIPIINRTPCSPCLNVIQPNMHQTLHPKVINNFNCVKLNATVVPIVKLNSIPSKLNGSNRTDIVGGQPTDLALLETAMPTVLTPNQIKINDCQPTINGICQTISQSLPPFNTLTSDTNICGIGVNNDTSPDPMDCQMDVSRCQLEPECGVNVCKQVKQQPVSVNECQVRTSERQNAIIHPMKYSQESSVCTNSSSDRKFETAICERIPSPNSDDNCNDSGISSELCSVRSSSSNSVIDKPRTPESDSSGISFHTHLEISVNAPTANESQKSPILSKPKTIRFPFKQQETERRDTRKSLSSSNDSGRCRWADCNAQFETSGALLEHLQHKHVISQATRDEYICFWSGCKVHGRTSCSRSWLERHVLAHAGTKLFRCIVDGCRQRFNSQLILQRHVNNHFNSDGKPNETAKKTPDTSSTKLFKRNGKKIRFRRQPWSARMFDFIDSGIMEGLQYKLMDVTRRRTLGNISTAGDEISLQSQILARRIESDGVARLLVRWHPPDIISDEWVNERDFNTVKVVQIPQLTAAAKDVLKPTLCLSPERTRKHRRKPSKEQT